MMFFMNIIKKKFFHIRRRYREYKMLRVVASHKNEIFVSGKISLHLYQEIRICHITQTLMG